MLFITQVKCGGRNVLSKLYWPYLSSYREKKKSSSMGQIVKIIFYFKKKIKTNRIKFIKHC